MNWTMYCHLREPYTLDQGNFNNLVLPSSPESYSAYEKCCPYPNYYAFRRGCGLVCYTNDTVEDQNKAPWLTCLMNEGWPSGTGTFNCERPNIDVFRQKSSGSKLKLNVHTSSFITLLLGIMIAITVL